MLSPIASWASETTLARSGTTSISEPHSGITSPADQLQPLAASLETLPSSLASLTCVLMPNSEPSHFALAPALTPPFLASTDGPSLPASAVMCTPSLAVWSFTPEIEGVSVPAEPRRLTEVGTDGSALAIDASACLVRPLASTFPRTSGMCSVAFEKRWLPTRPAIADASTVAPLRPLLAQLGDHLGDRDRPRHHPLEDVGGVVVEVPVDRHLHADRHLAQPERAARSRRVRRVEARQHDRRVARRAGEQAGHGGVAGAALQREDRRRGRRRRRRALRLAALRLAFLPGVLLHGVTVPGRAGPEGQPFRPRGRAAWCSRSPHAARRTGAGSPGPPPWCRCRRAGCRRTAGGRPSRR